MQKDGRRGVIRGTKFLEKSFAFIFLGWRVLQFCFIKSQLQGIVSLRVCDIPSFVEMGTVKATALRKSLKLLGIQQETSLTEC